MAEFVASGGKRIRPAYCHWGWVTAGGDPDDESELDAACALELLHAFALIHDDVMDGSPTRRSSPSAWARFEARHQEGAWLGERRRFSEAAAVLVGNIAFVLADRVFGNVNPEVRELWNTLRCELNMGQFLDVLGTAKGNVGVADARTIVRYKTAGYTIVRPLQIGAMLAGNADLAPRLESHGMPLGVAFQLRDDLLGAFGSPEDTGKPVGDDLREGKPTVLLAQARKLANAKQKTVLAEVGPGVVGPGRVGPGRVGPGGVGPGKVGPGKVEAGVEDGLDGDRVGAIQQVLIDTGAVAATEAEIERLFEESIVAIDALPDHHDSHKALRALAEYVVYRTT